MEGSYIRISKNYNSDVTFNYFFSRFSKSTENQSQPVKRLVKIQHCITQRMHRTTLDVTIAGGISDDGKYK